MRPLPPISIPSSCPLGGFLPASPPPLRSDGLAAGDLRLGARPQPSVRRKPGARACVCPGSAIRHPRLNLPVPIRLRSQYAYTETSVPACRGDSARGLVGQWPPRASNHRRTRSRQRVATRGHPPEPGEYDLSRVRFTANTGPRLDARSATVPRPPARSWTTHTGGVYTEGAMNDTISAGPVQGGHTQPEPTSPPSATMKPSP